MKKFSAAFTALILCFALAPPTLAAKKDAVAPEIVYEGEGYHITRTPVDLGGGEDFVPVFSEFSEGLAAVGENVIVNGRMQVANAGYIDSTGRLVIERQFDSAGNFSEGLAAVMKDGLCGMIDRAGNLVVPYEYEYLCDSNEGLIAAMKGGKFGFINRDNEVVIPFKWDAVANDGFMEGFASVANATGYDANGHKTYKCGVIDKSGEYVVPLEYGDLHVYSESLIPVEKKGKWGFLDKRGKTKIAFKFEDAGIFSEGLAAVKMGGKWGFVNRNGKIVVPFVYDSVGSFSNGLAWAVNDLFFGYIDASGEAQMGGDMDAYAISGFREGFAWCLNYDGETSFIIDTEGKVVLGRHETEEYQFSQFNGGLSVAAVYRPAEGQNGYTTDFYVYEIVYAP